MTNNPPFPLRLLYLHGFATGPDSTKAVVLADHYKEKGFEMNRLNLRVPSLENLRMSEMMKVTREAMGGPGEKAVLFGSSLGGILAARVAERDSRVAGLVLLAPAFGFVDSWRRELGEEGWAAWQRDGLEIQDYVLKRTLRLGFGFMEDAAEIERQGPPRVAAPVLIVHGRQDKVVDPVVSREWAAGKPNVRLIEVDDGHDLKASLPLIETEADHFLKNVLGVPL